MAGAVAGGTGVGAEAGVLVGVVVVVAGVVAAGVAAGDAVVAAAAFFAWPGGSAGAAGAGVVAAGVVGAGGFLSFVLSLSLPLLPLSAAAGARPPGLQRESGGGAAPG